MFNLSTANDFNSVTSKMLSFGKDLNLPPIKEYTRKTPLKVQ